MDVEGTDEPIVIGLEDIVGQYIIEAAQEAMQDLYEFLKQFQIKVEVNVVDGEEPLVDFAALEEWLRKETEDNG